MSLDKFAKPEKKKDGEKGPEKPAEKPPAEKGVKPAQKPAAAKGEKPLKPAKKAPAKRKTKPSSVEGEDDGEIESPPQEEGTQADEVEERAAIQRDSALKAMGLEKYVLSCPACKFKRELHVSGELKPHQLLCKKCGGTMKASKKT